jgi:hypothetical protein
LAAIGSDSVQPHAAMTCHFRARNAPLRRAGRKAPQTSLNFAHAAAVRCEANDRKWLNQLCQYIARPAQSDDYAQCDAAGQAEFKLKTLWFHGATHLMISPLDSRSCWRRQFRARASARLGVRVMSRASGCFAAAILRSECR